MAGAVHDDDDAVDCSWSDPGCRRVCPSRGEPRMSMDELATTPDPALTGFAGTAAALEASPDEATALHRAEELLREQDERLAPTQQPARLRIPQGRHG